MNNLSEATNNRMEMTTTNNNMTTLAENSPLKHLHNEWRHFGQKTLEQRVAVEQSLGEVELTL